MLHYTVALNEDDSQKEVLSTLRIAGDKPPGKQVLFRENHCQCFQKSTFSTYFTIVVIYMMKL